MKLRSVVLCAALVVLPCGGAAQQPPSPARASIADVGWVAGTWKTGATAVVSEELWTDGGGGSMFAIARTFKGDRLVAFEFLRIVERDGGLVYIAQPNGRPPTEFVLTAITAQSATFENPKHDFPRMIRYALRPDGRLEARVSDGGAKGETFVFARTR